MDPAPTPGPAPVAGALLWPVVVTGFGLGALLDGIVLHQVLQWHHVASAYRSADDLAGLERNTLLDGVFHLASWFVVLLGLLWTVRSGSVRRPLARRGVAGSLLVGCGAFQVTDQIVFHLLLGAHHVRMVENPQPYDWGYAALGAALIVVGARLDNPRNVSRSTSGSG